MNEKLKLPPELREWFKKCASLGGKAAAANMTPAERKIRSKAALTARWDAYRVKHPETKSAKSKDGGMSQEDMAALAEHRKDAVEGR